MSETGLVERGALLPSIEGIQKRLSDLVAAEDVQTLSEVRLQASAHQEYEARQQAKERADYFGRLKVLAEACIGAIDIAQHPRGWSRRNGASAAFKIGEVEISRDLRRTWRLLAIGEKQGLLQLVLDGLAASTTESIGTYVVADHLVRRGAGWVDTTPLRKQFKRAKRQENLRLSELAKKVGSNGATVGDALGVFSSSTQTRMRWDRAVPLAEALGVEPASLKPKPAKRRSPKRRRLLPPRQKATGGRWDETYSRFRRTLDEFARVAGEDARWDDAYAHFYALEDAIGKAMKEEPAA